MSKMPTLRLALMLASAVAWSSTTLAQDARPKDDALDSLLEKLDKPKNDAPGPSRPADKAPAEAKKDAEKPSGEVQTKDKALDSLLEKLGETRDAPSPDDRPRGGGPGGPSDQPPPPGPGDPKSREADDLKPDAKKLDQHLEELTGRKPRKKGQDDGDGNGPLSKVVKEMREVEERLGKPDTGDETRKKQAEIVKNLEQVIEQIRQQSGQQQGKKQLKLTMKPGEKPGSKPDQNQGAMANGVGPSKPLKPTSKHSLAGDKSEWGHLPPELRQEMENVFSEEGLPSKEELIRRYYLSLSKKSTSRED